MKKKIRNINKKYLLMIKKILVKKRQSIIDNYLTPEEKKLLLQLEDDFEYLDQNNNKVQKGR